jgi:prepilin-type N-terminal cleavage/methylation domain-containing protein
MRRNKGFTLIELMIVILIVGILAAVMSPMMTGRINRARWSEGLSGAGTIATSLRAYCAEQGVDINAAPALAAIGLSANDLQGKYFASGNYSITAISYTAATGALTYTIQVTAPTGVNGGPVTLDQAGTITGLP